MAWWHSRLIKANRPIVHGLWAAGYIAAVITIFIILRDPWLMISPFLIREVVFSPFLNFLRHKRFFYTNPASGSTIDKLEGKSVALFYFISIFCLIATQWILISKAL